MKTCVSYKAFNHTLMSTSVILHADSARPVVVLIGPDKNYVCDPWTNDAHHRIHSSTYLKNSIHVSNIIQTIFDWLTNNKSIA